MKLNQYIVNICNNLRGRLPATIFIWQLILWIVSIATILFILFWYYQFYIISYGDNADVVVEQYEEIIDMQKLEEALKLFDLN